MPARNTNERYGWVAQTLHWAIFFLLIVQFTLGKIADNLPLGLDRLITLARHKSFGITILALAVIRLLWRLINRPPPLPSMPGWQRMAAHLSHAGLYALLFAMPLTGWLMSSAHNYPVSWFGLVQLPDLITPDRDLSHDLEDIHELLSNILLELAAVHVLAALKHQFVDRDGLLLRMLPWPPR